MPKRTHVLLFALSLFLLPAASTAQVLRPLPDSSYAAIDSVYSLIKTHSLHRTTVDWARVDATFEASVDTARTFFGALEAFRGVFAALDDVHSAVYYAGRGIGFYRAPSRPVVRDVAALIARGRERAGQPEGILLDGGVGYLTVPAYGPPNQEAIDEASRTLRDVVCDLAPGVRLGWIVDLRVNEGGNVYPMLSGLGDLLGDGIVARTIEADGSVSFDWSIRDGILHLGTFATTTVERRCTDATRHGKIAVLIGPATLSSGQLTAIAFAGWDRARLFGDPSGDGYATGNQYYPIAPDLALNLSVSYFADRSGFVHRGIVLPDEDIEGEWQLGEPLHDPVVQRAMAWIAEN